MSEFDVFSIDESRKKQRVHSTTASYLVVFKTRDLVISEFEIARAKAAGAAGVTVVLALVGAERAAELAAFCKKLGESGWVGGWVGLV